MEHGQEISSLSEEVTRTRAERPGVRIQWPKEFRKRAAALLLRGVSSETLSSSTGIRRGTLEEWKKQESPATEGFSELSVSPKRRAQASGRAAVGEIMVQTPRGFRITLVLKDLHSLFCEGLL